MTKHLFTVGGCDVEFEVDNPPLTAKQDEMVRKFASTGEQDQNLRKELERQGIRRAGAGSENFKDTPGKLWRMLMHTPSGEKNLFLTAPTAEIARRQAGTITFPKGSQIGEATEAHYIVTAPAPVTTVLWVPKKNGQ